MTAFSDRYSIEIGARDFLTHIDQQQRSGTSPDPLVTATHLLPNKWPDLEGTTRHNCPTGAVDELIDLAWDAGLLLGPAQPVVVTDEYGEHVAYIATLGTYPARVHISTGEMEWKETADHDAVGVAWALSVLTSVADLLNNELDALDQYLAARQAVAA